MTVRFATLAVGDRLPELSKGPLNAGHIMRWSAAIENWHPLHYDWRYAVEKDGLPNVLINGSWKQQLLLQLLTDWIEDGGWLLRFALRYRRMNVPGDTITAWGEIAGREQRNGFGLVTIKVGLRDQKRVENTEGEATVVLPLSGGASLPYPFDPALVAG